MISLDHLLAATGGGLVGTRGADEFIDFGYDSRIVEPGQLFVAVVTETGDGHDFIHEACLAGATGVLCQRPPQHVPPGVSCILVDNTQQALLDYARYILRQQAVEVVGITGSVGKTATKEAVAAVLGTSWPVFKSFGNYSGRFGLPIALGKLLPEQHLAVLEMACDSLDEVRHLAEITRPRVGVITTIAESHLASFGSLEQIAREKGRLIEALPAEGTAILNADDPRVAALAGRTQAKVLTYGLHEEADLIGDEIRVTLSGTELTVWWQGERHRLRISYLGAHHAYVALAAAAVGIVYGLPWSAIGGALERLEPLPGRMRLLTGRNGSLLLDDSYNAIPTSALAALDTLRDLPAGRRFVVLGEMSQLGDLAEEGHRRVGRRIAQVADRLIAKGEMAEWAAAAAREAGMAPEHILVAYTDEDIIRELSDRLGPGDLVLLKGSAEARLEEVARRLMADPERARELLPRQHRGWRQVRLQRPGRPTWLEVDLDAIAYNVRRLVEIVGPDVDVLAVLKADGYGHGALKVARTALNNGAKWLGVACLGEAIALRSAGIEAPILILGYTPPWQSRDAVRHGVVCTLFSQEVAMALSQAALDLGSTARVHIKVDTGMGRLGLLPEEVLPFVQTIAGLPGLEIDGIFTHFADADAPELDYTRWQLARFRQVLEALDEAGLKPPCVHAANSAALLRLPESRFDMVRPGIALYGLNPSPHAPLPGDFRRALSFKCQVAQVKELPAGSFISYGRTYRTERPSRIAVIPVGYADGFRRAPQHWGEVLVRGRRAPIVGRVCMDQTMLDVTDIPHVRQGDEVVLIGSQGEETITVDEVARRLGTINYEVISEILARVPRMV
ncbi:MAG: alanine racemase [Chloroflexi bacterium]|nr:alanine racemase [Chloroflexota bacterium]